MYHQEFEPPGALRNAVKCFWYNCRWFGNTFSAFEVVPDGYAEIIFHFGDLYSQAYYNATQPLPSPFLMGLLNQPAVFQAKGKLEIIAVRCYPWAVFDLLGLPANKGGIHVMEHPVAGLQTVLSAALAAGHIDEALLQLEQYFLAGQSSSAATSMLSRAGDAMRKANGRLPVNQVAAAAHATVRTLERNFKEAAGHTVKDVSALMRFEQVRNRLWNDAEINLAGLSYELGYTDQSHLSREFKLYSGTTPAAFARKAKQRRQIPTDDFVAFVQDRN